MILLFSRLGQCSMSLKYQAYHNLSVFFWAFGKFVHVICVYMKENMMNGAGNLKHGNNSNGKDELCGSMQGTMSHGAEASQEICNNVRKHYKCDRILQRVNLGTESFKHLMG